MRPKVKDGEFHVGIVGKNFDPVDLVDPAKFVEFFHENTGRRDVVFKKMTSTSHWK